MSVMTWLLSRKGKKTVVVYLEETFWLFGTQVLIFSSIICCTSFVDVALLGGVVLFFGELSSPPLWLPLC